MTELVRTPILAGAGAPGCFSAPRGDATCAACPFADRCEAAAQRHAARDTLQEAADRALAEYRVGLAAFAILPEDLAAYAQSLFVAKGGAEPFKKWRGVREWQDACERVIVACQREGWDARTYVRAQVESIGWWCVQKKWAMRPNMLTGGKSGERFARWRDRNQKRHGDAARDKTLDHEHEALLAAECEFGVLYFEHRESKLSHIAPVIEERHPVWNLDQTDSRPHVRLPALVAAAASLDPSLPTRVLMPPKAWTWPAARKFFVGLCADVAAQRTVQERVELDAGLGTLL